MSVRWQKRPVLSSAASEARDRDRNAMMRNAILHLLDDPGVACRVSRNLVLHHKPPPRADQFHIREFLETSDGGLRCTTGLAVFGSAVWAALSHSESHRA